MARGWIEKRTGKHGMSYRLRWEAPAAAGGTEVLSETVRPLPGEDAAATRRRAEGELAVRVAAVYGGTHVARSRLTLDELLDRWFVAADGDLSPSTVGRYRRAANDVRTALGPVRLEELTTVRLQAFYDGLRLRGLAPNTIRTVHKVLGGALKQAVLWGLLRQNPAAGVKLPAAQPREHAVWTTDQLAAFLAAEGADELVGALWRLLLTTGMRIGEALALRWGDVDLAAGRLFVRRTLTEDEDGHVTIGGTTKGRRRRSIALTPSCVAALTRHRARQDERRLVLGTAWIDATEDRVYDRGDGSLFPPDAVRYRFDRACARAGVPRLRLHDQRHTSATVDLEAGAHPKIVADRLGHAKTAITLDLYSHVSDDLQRRAAERLDALIAEADARRTQQHTAEQEEPAPNLLPFRKRRA